MTTPELMSNLPELYCVQFNGIYWVVHQKLVWLRSGCWRREMKEKLIGPKIIFGFTNMFVVLIDVILWYAFTILWACSIILNVLVDQKIYFKMRKMVAFNGERAIAEKWRRKSCQNWFSADSVIAHVNFIFIAYRIWLENYALKFY